MSTFTPDPVLDLHFERIIPVSPEKVWAAWTQPELMVQWFTPAPWKTVSCDVDPRPGGRFYITNTDGLQLQSLTRTTRTPSVAQEVMRSGDWALSDNTTGASRIVAVAKASSDR